MSSPLLREWYLGQDEHWMEELYQRKVTELYRSSRKIAAWFSFGKAPVPLLAYRSWELW